MDSSCSKAPNFLKADFKGNIRDEGGRCVVVGWWRSFNCRIFWNFDVWFQAIWSPVLVVSM